MSITIKVFAVIGFTFLLTIMFGIFLDIADFDKTKGGYEPPYIGVTGEPVDWDNMDLTSIGLAKRGHVINVLVNGTTGMISFEIFKHKIEWRVFSDRALVVHKPKEALIRRGFNPIF